MQAAIPSLTALSVALRRAAHQLYDSPLVFPDPLAVSILGDDFAESLRRTPRRADRPHSTSLRAFLVARSRHAEDALACAVNTGIQQYVLLGAGLDTFAYRNPYPDLRVFELDHPITQQWKLALLARNNITIPPSLTYVPADLEHQTLQHQLTSAGFDPHRPAFFSWLGVVPYLTLDAFRSTVSFVASMPSGSALTLDYAQPRSVLPPNEQLAHDSLASRVEARGEPFQLFFTPPEVAAEMYAFHPIEDLGRDQINARYFTLQGRSRPDRLEIRGQAGRLLTAWKG
jgi:methyltransferase (TIGR00027 family)